MRNGQNIRAKSARVDACAHGKLICAYGHTPWVRFERANITMRSLRECGSAMSEGVSLHSTLESGCGLALFFSNFHRPISIATVASNRVERKSAEEEDCHLSHTSNCACECTL